MRSRAGDWVEVRSKLEILRSLDSNGRLDNMPFMPEMFEYCGKRFRVYKCAHKGCDTINPTRMRALSNAVMLDNLRCSGVAHGGCQAACSIFWKDAWLTPVEGGTDRADEAQHETAPQASACTEQDVIDATRNGIAANGKPRFSCQATDFPEYTTQLRTRDIGQFIKDYRSRNVGIAEFIMTIPYFVYNFMTGAESRTSGEFFRRLYDRFQALWGGVPYPRRWGTLADASNAPLTTLNLQPGEFVRVKSYEEILATLSTENTNRGLYFDAEMVPFCGGIFRVRSRVDYFIDEKAGFMRTMKTPAIILENVWCRARFSNRRLFCPRAIYPWWREAWLERAPEATEESVADALGARVILSQAAAETSA